MSILQNGAPVLREKAKEVAVASLPSPEINQVIKEMREALSAEHDGVAIAAPQIGHPLRIFVVSELVFTKDKKHTEEKPKESFPLVYINPVITKFSKTKKFLEEGCLSVRPWYGKVPRSTRVTVKAYDEHGKVFERGASGLLAQIFQHETDHLNGILFIDTAKDLHEVHPEDHHE